MTDLRMSIKYFVGDIAEMIKGLFVTGGPNGVINDAVRHRLASLNLRRIFYLTLAACIQDSVILLLNFTKGENNIYGGWLRASCAAVIAYNVVMFFISFHLQRSLPKKLHSPGILNLFVFVYWIIQSLLMLNFVAMDLLADSSYLNYYLLLILLSALAVLDFRQWLPTAGTVMALLLAMIFTLGLDRMHIYYIITLFLGACLFNRISYTSYANTLSARQALEDDNKCLREQCNTDPLTGLLNRRGFEVKSKRLWENCLIYGGYITAVFIDVDSFKLYNDCYGHQKGDECLARIAGCISGIAGCGGNVVSRYGGEEFLLLLDGVSGSEAVETALSIKDSVEKLRITAPPGSASEYLTISIGLSSAVPSGSTGLDELLRQTDKHLYSAKNNGRNSLVYDKE